MMQLKKKMKIMERMMRQIMIQYLVKTVKQIYLDNIKTVKQIYLDNMINNKKSVNSKNKTRWMKLVPKF